MTNTSDGICRVCESTDDLEMIFEEVNAEILEMLQAASDSEIRADDGFPKHVCIACIFSLEDFYQFKSLYESTYRKWKRLTNGSGQIKESAGKTIDPEVGTNAKIRFHTPEEANEIFFNSQVVDDQSGSSDSVRDGIEKQAATYVMNGKESVASSYRNAVQDQQQNSENPPDVNIIAREQLPSTDKDNANEKRHVCEEFNDVYKTKIDCTSANHNLPRVAQPRQEFKYQSKNNLGDESHMGEDCGVTTKDANMEALQAVRYETLSNSNCYKGEICGELFTGLYSVEVHGAVHNNSNIYKCRICSKEYTNRETFMKHMKGHSNPDVYKCDKCGKCYTSARYLKEHKFSHSDSNACDICGKTFGIMRLLKIHKELHKNPKLFTCDICEKTFADANGLKKHKFSHSTLNKCNKCDKSFGSMQALRQHLLFHNNPDLFKCDECGKIFGTLPNLNRHLALHKNPTLHKCDKCDKLFTNANNLAEHQFSHSGQNKCEECGKTFTTLKDFKAHLTAHINPQLFKCDECGKSFVAIKNLKHHKLSIHGPSKRHNCTKCGKSFAGLRYLRRHSALHLNPNLYTCEICGDSFSSPRMLKSHKKWHLNPLEYKCEECGKSYKSKQALKTHIVLHSDLYKCNECGQSFSRLKRLQLHLAKHKNP